MSRIIIICEGETEQAFCQTMLRPYFSGKSLYVQSPLIKQTKGGITNWVNIRTQIENTLKQDGAAYVSLLIDYYGIYQKHNFPGWGESLTMADKNARITFLEQKMREDIDETLRYRFIPYMQLHEFEGLLFTHINILAEAIGLPRIRSKCRRFNAWINKIEALN
jgi:hypothetical protein